MDGAHWPRLEHGGAPAALGCTRGRRRRRGEKRPRTEGKDGGGCERLRGETRGKGAFRSDLGGVGAPTARHRAASGAGEEDAKERGGLGRVQLVGPVEKVGLASAFFYFLSGFLSFLFCFVFCLELNS